MQNLAKHPIVKLVAYIIAIAALAVLGVWFPRPDEVPPVPEVTEIVRPPDVEFDTTHLTALQVEDLTATDDVAVTDDLTVTGATALNGGITADTNKFTVADTSGNTAIAGTLTATGATALNGGLTMDTDKFTVADTSGNTAIAGTLTATGATALNGGLTMDTDKFTVADTSGNTSVGGTFAVTGASAFSNNVTLASTKKLITEDSTNTCATFACVNTIAYTDITSKTICVIPANVDLVDVQFVVETAFNGGGTDVVDCGWDAQADPDDIVDDLDASSAGVNRAGDNADMPYAILADIGGSDLTLKCLYTDQNSDSSAGAATIRVFYTVR
jgi:hypothetical protein